MNPKRPVPDGFYERASETNAVLMKDFHCKPSQIKRWRSECGIKVKRMNSPRRVHKYTEDGIYLATYNSIGEAGRSVWGSSSNICKVLSGEKTTAYGYVWRYADERK